MNLYLALPSSRAAVSRTPPLRQAAVASSGTRQHPGIKPRTPSGAKPTGFGHSVCWTSPGVRSARIAITEDFVEKQRHTKGGRGEKLNLHALPPQHIADVATAGAAIPIASYVRALTAGAALYFSLNWATYRSARMKVEKAQKEIKWDAKKRIVKLRRLGITDGDKK